MNTYIVRRLVSAVPLVLGIATIVFFAVNLAPGDPSLMYVGRNFTEDTREQIRVNMGLDQPLHIRYVKWMTSLARGNLRLHRRLRRYGYHAIRRHGNLLPSTRSADHDRRAVRAVLDLLDHRGAGFHAVAGHGQNRAGRGAQLT